SPETRTRDTLIKSQGQSGPERNINKKESPTISRLAWLFLRQWKGYMFCPGSGTKQAQPKTQRLKDRPSSCPPPYRYWYRERQKTSEHCLTFLLTTDLS